MLEDGSKNTVRFLTIDSSGHDRFSVNSVSCCLGIPDHLKDINQRTVKGTNTGQTAQSDVDGWITPFLTFVEDVFSLLPQNLNGVRRRLCLLLRDT
jgi:hypothetical protein